MKKLTLALVLAGFCVPAVHAQDVKSDILIVDVQRAIEQSQEHIDLVEVLRKSIANKKKDVADEVQRMKLKQQDLLKVELTKRNDDWYTEVEKVLHDQGRLKAEEAFFISKLNDQLARKLNALIRGVQQESRAVMNERGAKMVLTSKMGAIRLETQEDMKDELIRRRVIAAVAGVDITDDVVKRMDAWYAKHGKKGKRADKDKAKPAKSGKNDKKPANMKKKDG